MKYYLIAGEASGDLHASNLIKAVKAADPEAQFRCWGGDRMRDAGAFVVKHYKELAFMGFWEVFVHLREILANFKACRKDLTACRPDVLVLVDYPGFNLRMAAFAKRHGIKVVYYISPQVWAWKKGRIRKIRKYVDEMMVILPFEKDFYAKNGMRVHYVGHPLLDAVSKDLPERADVLDFRKRHQLDSRPIIALLPGSRRQEIAAILPVMLRMVPLFPQYRFVLSMVSWLPAALYDKYAGGVKVARVCDDTYPLLANAAAAVVASGTATLEAALIGVPQVVCYAGSELSYRIAKSLVRGISHISLVNLIMDRPVVAELIQHDYNPVRLEEALRLLVSDRGHIAAMKENYRRLHALLGDGSASARAAEVVVGAAAGATSPA